MERCFRVKMVRTGHSCYLVRGNSRGRLNSLRHNQDIQISTAADFSCVAEADWSRSELSEVMRPSWGIPGWVIMSQPRPHSDLLRTNLTTHNNIMEIQIYIYFKMTKSWKNLDNFIKNVKWMQTMLCVGCVSVWVMIGWYCWSVPGQCSGDGPGRGTDCVLRSATSLPC